MAIFGCHFVDHRWHRVPQNGINVNTEMSALEPFDGVLIEFYYQLKSIEFQKVWGYVHDK
jgi:hypothetical protein